MRERLQTWIADIHKHVDASLTTDYTPRQTAASFALAISLAVLPTFGMAPLIALGIGTISDRINQYAMAAAFIIFNPFVLSGVLTLSFLVGDALSPLLPGYTYEIPVSEQLFLFTRSLLLGNVVINIVLSTTGYLAAYRFVREYQESSSRPWNVPA